MPFTCNYHDLAKIAKDEEIKGSTFNLNVDESVEYLMRKKRSTFFKRQPMLLSSFLNNHSVRLKTGAPYLFHTKRLLPEMSEVDRFNAIKNFLSGNSYESSDGVVYIFAGKLLQALIEVSSMKTVEADSHQSSQISSLNSSQLVTMNVSKTKNESSLSVVPTDVRLSKVL